MKITIPHDAPWEVAKRGAELAFAHYVVRYARYEPRLSWESPKRFRFSLTAKGLRVSGTATLDDGSVAVDIEVPFPFRVFESRARQAVAREVALWVAKARLVAEPPAK
jgi:hypothetical protein